MTQISIKSIETAVEKIDSLDEDALEKFSETHVLQQDVFVGYIMSSAIEYQNELLMDLLIYYFNIFSEAHVQEGVLVEKITEDDIDVFQEEFHNLLDEYMESEDMDLIRSFCNQDFMLTFLLAELEMEDEDGEKLDDDTATYLFIVGTAMIALFNRHQKK